MTRAGQGRILTEQEKFWAGEFGNEYIKRNKGADSLASKIYMFSQILRVEKINSCIEFGANIGLNLRAIQALMPSIKLAGIEINKEAATELRKINNIETFEKSIIDFEAIKKYDLSFVCGVLIHINPDMLDRVYESLYESSNRYICVAEYYNPTPVEVSYRGNKGKLFKRDFAGELMDKYKNLVLLDYGFIYHRDNNFPGDDITWFLMEKK